jgi:hypothetical protein
MFVDVIFQFGSELVFVRVDGSNCFFRTKDSSGFATIDGIKLDKAGVIKEFPELENNENWQSIAREKFKEKLKTMNNEKERISYVIEELGKHNYKAIKLMKQGSRPLNL